VLDILALALAALTVVVVLTGGGHVHVAGIRVSFASWLRLLAWTLGVGLVRHLVMPTPSILTAALRSGLVAIHPVAAAARLLLAQPAWQAVAAPAACSRLVVYLVGFVGTGVFGVGLRSRPFRYGVDHLGSILGRWDANWYTAIATSGYHWSGDHRAENSVVFFPAYPMLMRLGAWITRADPAYVGFFLSMCAFAWALVYVFRLARDDFRLDAPAAAVSMLAWYPFAVFFGAVYAESLFLLALAGCFYHAARRERWRSAAWVLLASLTKPSGFFMVAPLSVLFLVRWWRESGNGWRLWRDRDARRAALADALILVVPLLGVAGYSLFLWRLTGDPLAWLHGQEAWGRTAQSPLARLYSGYETIAANGVIRTLMIWPADSLNTLATLFALAAIIPVWRRLGVAYAVLIFVVVVPPLLAGGVLSMGRFTSCLFPVFIWLAAAVPARHRGTVYAVFAAGQALIAILFLTFRPPY
jgi:hypothetical protein